LTDNADAVAMFLDEARLAAGIHHPNVAGVLDLGQDAGRHFVAMELVEGASLDKLLEAQKPSAPVVIRVVLDALEGLEAAHSAKGPDGARLAIVHRDISPQNVLVGIDGRARITDFGIARAASRLRETQGIELKGKLPYMAPEQLRAKPFDHRADLFAMGVVLWEGLTQERLFDSVDRSAIESVADTLPAELATGAGDAIDRVCARAIRIEPENRLASAADFAAELRRAAESSTGIATHAEVGAYVDALVGEAVRARRGGDPSLAIDQAPAANGRDAGAVTADLPSLGVFASAPKPVVPMAKESPPKKRFAAPIALGFAAFVALFVAYVASRRPAVVAPTEGATSLVATVAAPTTEPTVEAKAPSVATEAPSAATAPPIASAPKPRANSPKRVAPVATTNGTDSYGGRR
jgi:serine/threonine-protein kinase